MSAHKMTVKNYLFSYIGLTIGVTEKKNYMYFKIYSVGAV